MPKPLLKAILVDLPHPRLSKAQSMERLVELEQLVETYGGVVIVKTYQRRVSPDSQTFIGSGKVEEIREEGKTLGLQLLILNDILKPRQIYQLSEELREAKIQVWDRVDLILKIFAKHAKTTEARLEIELASVRHMGPRIFGMGMELSRQAGGIGTVGIGEKNTEIMKRHLRAREEKIRKDLQKYQTVRAGHRQNRRRQELKTVSLVGYTNAGKTTVLNALTRRKEYADDKLFATLDTRVGNIFLPSIKKSVLISDTIGFIKDLPPQLLHAFRSTLSEAVESDLLLHVIDASDPRVLQKIATVEDVLTQLDIADKPRLYVFNKIDQASKLNRTTLLEKFAEFHPVFISAAKQEGLEALKQLIETRLYPVSV